MSSAFSRLRGLPSAAHWAAPSELSEAEGALRLPSDPSSHAPPADLSALSLLHTLRKTSEASLVLASEESERAVQHESEQAMSPWSDCSSDAAQSELLPSRIWFVDEGVEMGASPPSTRASSPAAAVDRFAAEPQTDRSEVPVEQSETAALSVPYRLTECRPGSARMEGAQAMHAQHLKALINVIGSGEREQDRRQQTSELLSATPATTALTSTDSPATPSSTHPAPSSPPSPSASPPAPFASRRVSPLDAAEGDQEQGASALDSKLEGVLATLQRCRESLNTQAATSSQSLADEEFIEQAGIEKGMQGEEGGEVSTLDPLRERELEFEGESEGSASEGYEEEGGTVALLLQHFPLHIGELFSSESADLKELALNRLLVHLRRRDASGVQPSEGAQQLYEAADRADAEAEAVSARGGDSPPRFWARATPLLAGELSELKSEGDVGAGGEVFSSEDIDSMLLAACWMVRDALMEEHPRVLCAALSLLQHDSPLLSSAIPACSSRGVRRALPLLSGPLAHVLSSSSARIANGAACALIALTTHPSSCPSLLPPLYATPLGEPRTAELRLRLLLCLLGGPSLIGPSDLDLSRPMTAGGRPSTALPAALVRLGSSASFRAPAHPMKVPSSFTLIQRPSSGETAAGILRLCGEGLRSSDAAVRQAAVELLLQVA
ncbi:MAG: hypothetical protein SGPRY_000731 [Prymnesium sp.]